ncbi:MAG: glycosyltransferase family 2 protein [Lachnospiraceae bacterium]|nr:glycosyltransferase family 2 protein [Lachnospiraceae bacterium]
MMKFSLCMIVKNESHVLARCLDSLQGLFDQIVIVDTGSTDDTKEIAARYTDEVYDFVWQDDFSAARNFAFSKCSGDYIYSADADEVLDSDNRRRFFQLKEAMLPEIEIVQMKYVEPDSQTVMNSIAEYRPKLFRRLRTFTWIDPVHESVRLDPVVYNSDIEILHLPETKHTGRDFSIFEKAYKRDGVLSKKICMTYARELLKWGKPADFAAAADIFHGIEKSNPDDSLLLTATYCVLAHNARIQASRIDEESEENALANTGFQTSMADDESEKNVVTDYAKLQKNSAEFMKYTAKLLVSNPPAEICYELGEYFEKARDYDEASIWFYNAAFETESSLDIHRGGDLALKKLSECYTALANQAEEDENPNISSNVSTLRKLAEKYQKQADDWTMPEGDM